MCGGAFVVTSASQFSFLFVGVFTLTSACQFFSFSDASTLISANLSAPSGKSATSGTGVTKSTLIYQIQDLLDPK